jgi:hypothetical protein
VYSGIFPSVRPVYCKLLKEGAKTKVFHHLPWFKNGKNVTRLHAFIVIMETILVRSFNPFVKTFYGLLDAFT